MSNTINVENIEQRETWPGQIEQYCEATVGARRTVIVVPGEIPVQVGDTLTYELVRRIPTRWTYTYTINGVTHFYVVDMGSESADAGEWRLQPAPHEQPRTRGGW